MQQRMREKCLVSTARVLVHMLQLICTFHHKNIRKSHNHVTWKYTQQKHDKPFNSIAVVILMTSAAQQAIWPIIRDTSGEITSTTLSSAEELVRLNFEVEH